MNNMSSSQNKPLFITFEGGDGAGKSTHINFLARVLEHAGYEVISVREPGSTQIGERIRDILLDTKYEAMSPEAELFLYEAARAQLVHEIIAPALQQGHVVLCDRFSDSTIAYQAYGRKLSKDFIEEANRFACTGIQPQATILMKAPSIDAGIKRATKDIPADRLELEGSDFHVRVQQGFNEIAHDNPERVHVVVSADTKAQTARLICSYLSEVFPILRKIPDEVFQALDTGMLHEVLQHVDFLDNEVLV